MGCKKEDGRTYPKLPHTCVPNQRRSRRRFSDLIFLCSPESSSTIHRPASNANATRVPLNDNFEEVRCFLLSNDFARLVVDTNAWIDSQDWLRHGRPVDQLMSSRPIGEFAQRRLSKMTGKLLKLGGVAEHGNLEDWHRLRIMIKKVKMQSILTNIEIATKICGLSSSLLII